METGKHLDRTNRLHDMYKLALTHALVAPVNSGLSRDDIFAEAEDTVKRYDEFMKKMG
jgi:hypothetical protein